MNRRESITKPLMWLMTVFMMLFVVACGGGGGGGSAAVAITSAKAMTAFSILGVTGKVNESAKTIAIVVPFATDVTALVSTFTSTGGSVKVATVAQTSGVTANDFTSPVTYTVTATNGTTAAYVVTVTVASVSAKAITAYAIAGVAGVINEAGKTISVTLPTGTSVVSKIATFTKTGVSINVGVTPQISGTTANNFTAPVAYIVTAADASTATYTVTVLLASADAKAMTVFSLAGVAGTINEAGKTIAVALPSGTNLAALIASFTTTGASVKVGAVTQASGASANNFTSPVAYVVTAADATTATYTITATVAGAGPAPVALGMAGNYVIFTDTGISNATPLAVITGDMGVGPGVTSTAITGFALNLPVGSAFSTSAQVAAPGKVYAFDYAVPTPTDVTTASNDMGFAYDDAAGRLLPDFTDLFIGNIGGQTLVPGLYRWNSAVTVPFGTNVTFSGGPNDVWIIQITGTLDLAASTQVFLLGGALPKNIFWQVAGAVTLGASSHMEGVVLAKTDITLGSLADANSRLLAQTRVNLDQNTVTQPAP